MLKPMERGNILRAKRDVLARKLEKHQDGIKTPYALSTWMVQQGAKVGPESAVKREFVSQKVAKRKAIAKLLARRKK